jgi:hypothetical protein
LNIILVKFSEELAEDKEPKVTKSCALAPKNGKAYIFQWDSVIMQAIYQNKVALVLGWLIGALIVIIGFFTIISNVGINYSKGLYSGIFYLLAGLIIFPPFDKILGEKILHRSVPGWLNGLLFLIFMLIASYL